MKKMIMMLVAVAACFAANASTFNWKNTGLKTAGTIYDYTGTAMAAGTTAYLFCATDITQAALLEAVRADGASALTSKAIGGDSTATLNTASKIAATPEFEYGTAGNYYDFYFAILDDANQKLLISAAVVDQAAQLSDPTAMSFTGSATWSKVDNGAATYSAAGWYDVAPEPTSGLMMLLGMGVLALRRRRA